MQKNRLILFIIFDLVVVAAGLFFLSQTGPNSEDDGKIKVVASTMIVADIARNVGGDKIEVVQIMPNGADPHEYQPSIEDKQRVADADVLFVVGVDFDKWAESIVEPGTKTISLDRNVALLSNNPHYWLSISSAHIMSGTVRDELITLDPTNEAIYRANYEKYTQRLANLRSEMTTSLKDIKTRKIITYHNAFDYFALDFDLEIVATVEPANGQEPSAQYLASVGEEIKKNDIRVLFKEPQESEELVNTLAKDYGLEVHTLDAEGGVEGIDTFEELIKYNAETLKQGLS